PAFVRSAQFLETYACPVALFHDNPNNGIFPRAAGFAKLSDGYVLRPRLCNNLLRIFRGGSDQIPRLVFSEPEADRVWRALLADKSADIPGQCHFGNPNQHTAIGHVMHRVGQSTRDQGPREVAMLAFRRRIDRRRGALLLAFDLAQIDRLAEM